ncbi:DUF3265 domain-containing protein [Vibrio campbellii]
MITKRPNIKAIAYKCLTSRLRVIRNAWHFYNALRLLIKVVCGDIGIAVLTPQ